MSISAIQPSSTQAASAAPPPVSRQKDSDGDFDGPPGVSAPTTDPTRALDKIA
jgi:hypothetical protein